MFWVLLIVYKKLGVSLAIRLVAKFKLICILFPLLPAFWLFCGLGCDNLVLEQHVPWYHNLRNNLQWTQKLVYFVNPGILVPQPEEQFAIERLKTLGGTEFSGTAKPEEAEKWLRTLKKCSTLCNIRKKEGWILATFLLQEEVEDRWILKESRWGKVNWEEFKKIFNGKYFSVTYIEEKGDEFLFWNKEDSQLQNMRGNSWN